MQCFFFLVENSKDTEGEEEGELHETKPGLQLQHPVAGVHVTLRLKQAQRRTLFSGTDTFKRALSARRDIAIRYFLFLGGAYFLLIQLI